MFIMILEKMPTDPKKIKIRWGVGIVIVIIIILFIISRVFYA